MRRRHEEEEEEEEQRPAVDRTSRGEWGGFGVRRVGRWTGQVEVSGAAVVSDGLAGGRDK